MLQPIVRPLQEFLSTETAGGVLLLLAAIAALIWANAPGTDSYADFWNAHIHLDLNVVDLDLSLQHWVNDALMAIFFFVVGMEIKRELLKGELADPRKAALPVAAALGGMIVPALIYASMNFGGDGSHGWGIPMATDIAFAVGVLTLLGTRVPVSLKVFLLALAITDDLGAIAVIAIFYSESIEFGWLAAAVGAVALTAVMGRLGVRDLIVYIAVGLFAWLAVYESGVHATIAGVALGLLAPVNAFFSNREVEQRVMGLAEELRRGEAEGTPEGDELGRSALRELEELARESRPVLDRLEHALHPWTSYAIIPIFALANAGVELSGDTVRDAATSPVGLGVALGLMLGKPIGITLFSFVAVRSGLASLPGGVSWAMLAATGMIAGIGFTVSLFIADLAFDSAALVDEAKIGILAGSALIGVAGFVALRWLSPAPAASRESHASSREITEEASA
ncbi:MAG TPA: Na+/H+ antiporter NhaA [Dehalococcoidia bacterium]|nr:Na+/H+ antiporter NhaA [Dehalococcoidia bacterium]